MGLHVEFYEMGGSIIMDVGSFYLEVVQAVIHFVSDMCVMSPHIRSMLVLFHHCLMFQMMGRKTISQVDGSWSYPPLAITIT